MFGYDWPRLHAALNDLPTALLVTAALFELLALATRREAFRQVSFWTLLIGALFPMVTSLYTQEQSRQVGLKVGSIAALNTLGAIAGTLITGFLLIPWLGLRNTAIALSGLSLVIGMVATWLIGIDVP